jgi:hypothetical protein
MFNPVCTQGRTPGSSREHNNEHSIVFSGRVGEFYHEGFPIGHFITEFSLLTLSLSPMQTD